MQHRETSNARPFRLASRPLKSFVPFTRRAVTKRVVTKKRKQGDLAAAFKMEAFSHLEAIFLDALCLTGSRDEASDLVIAAYVRAFLHYESFRRRRTRNAVDWLYANLHAVYCDEILARANRSRLPTGG